MSTDLVKLLLLIWLIIRTVVEILDFLEWVWRLYNCFKGDSGRSQLNFNREGNEILDHLFAVENYDSAFHYYVKHLVESAPNKEEG